MARTSHFFYSFSILSKTLEWSSKNLTSHEQKLIKTYCYIHKIFCPFAGKLAMRGDIEEAIDENKYNHITSTYYLLAHRSLQIEDKAKRTETSLRDVSMPITVQSGTSILPQSLGKSKTYFGTSPPCQQASLSPSYHPSLHMSGQSLQNESDVGEDSSPSSSSSSLYHSANYLHHSNRGDRKMSPPFPREHLTITPRHGFSVAKGGIDTLIEEEERSRSQTTTDDEEDESITSAHIIHPAQIASS